MLLHAARSSRRRPDELHEVSRPNSCTGVFPSQDIGVEEPPHLIAEPGLNAAASAAVVVDSERSHELGQRMVSLSGSLIFPCMLTRRRPRPASRPIATRGFVSAWLPCMSRSTTGVERVQRREPRIQRRECSFQVVQFSFRSGGRPVYRKAGRLTPPPLSRSGSSGGRTLSFVGFGPPKCNGWPPQCSYDSPQF